MTTLEDFVSETLLAICKGVDKAKKEASGDGSSMVIGVYRRHERDKVRGQLIDFDVSITATDELKGKAGVGIKILSANLEGKNTAYSENRVKFSVPVVMPDADI